MYNRVNFNEFAFFCLTLKNGPDVYSVFVDTARTNNAINVKQKSLKIQNYAYKECKFIK